MLGLKTLVAIVIANMIGVGVFMSSGFSLAALGNPGRVMLAWSLCGVWAICGAISYGGLVARLPQSGGEYLFLSRFVHPSVGFLAGWISLVAGFTAPIAAAAKAAATHIIADSQSGDLRVSLLAAGLIFLATAFHIIGIRVGTGVQNAIVATKLLLMLWVVVVAYLLTAGDQWRGTALPDRDTGWLPENAAAWWALAGSMSWLALSYTGFNAGIYVAGESKNARRWVPVSMVVGAILVTAIYLLLNYIFVFFPEPQSLLGEQGFGEEKVAIVAATALGGASLSTVVRIIVILSTCSSVFAMLMLGPRVYHKMAVDQVFPAFFRDESYRATILLQCLLSVMVCFAGNMLQLMSYLGLTLSACGALAVGSLLWVRRTLPDATPLSSIETVATAIYLAMTGILIAATRTQRPIEFWAMIGTFVLGLLLFAIWHWKDVLRPNPKVPHVAE